MSHPHRMRNPRGDNQKIILIIRRVKVDWQPTLTGKGQTTMTDYNLLLLCCIH